jgi:trehalose-6-phosphate hydrolase
VPFIYFGEEIGMTNHLANSFTEIKDIQGITYYNMAIADGKTEAEALLIGNNNNRDKSRSPMQWSTDTLSGFSKTSTWIPINPDYKTVNVAYQENDSTSILFKYKQLIAIRNTEPALQYGLYKELSINKDCIHFIRNFNNSKINVLINFGEPTNINIPENAKVLLGSPKLKTNDILIYKTFQAN